MNKQRTQSRVMALLLGALCAIIYLVVIIPLSNRKISFSRQGDVNVGVSIDSGDEKLAKDTRLDKYQTPDDTLFCPEWSSSNPSFSELPAFELPASTNLTFFLSRGKRMSGNFIIHSERTTLRSDIIVKVTAQHASHLAREQLKKTKVCIAGQDHEQGILLWADSDAALDENVKFNISVHLPDITIFHDISTDFTNSKFTHFVEDIFDLWRPTVFGRVRLNARDAPITVMTMITVSIFAHTTNAILTGGFWSAQGVALQTSNAPLVSTVWCLGYSVGAETSLFIKTNDAPITALISMASDFSHTKLNASVHTTLGSIDIIMPHAMLLDSPVFVFDVSTTHAPVSLYLAPEYEGPFDLHTTDGGEAIIEWNPDIRDPSNGGRKRVLEMEWETSRMHKTGKMYWGKESHKENFGDIKMRTTAKDVVIHTSAKGSESPSFGLSFEEGFSIED